jgi:hypothetical protein
MLRRLRAALLVAALVAGTLPLAAGCRDDDDSASDAGGDDLSVPAQVDCSTVSDCLACCSAENASGALDFDSSLQSCVCAGSPCEAACAQTVCGSGVGIDAACRACLLATAGNDGGSGVCGRAVAGCVADVGPCADWKSCVDRCP